MTNSGWLVEDVPPREPVSSLEVDGGPGRYSAESLFFLKEHGAHMKAEGNILRIFFPDGTTMQELGPHEEELDARIITFPDGSRSLYLRYDNNMEPGYQRMLLVPGSPA
jgi:hypothetical protein